MQLLSGEFILLSILLFIGVRLKAKFTLTERILRGLHVYFPPTLDQINERQQTEDRFSITYLEIDDAFSRKSSYFADADFLVLLALVALSLTLASFGLKDSGIANFEQNLSFYMLVTVLFLCTFGVYSQLTKSGVLNPDNYMAFMLTLTIFSFNSILLTIDHASVLDFNFVFSVKMLNKRLTYVVQHFMDSSVNPDYTFFVIGLVGVVSVVMMPYFRFIIRLNLNTAVTEGLDREKAWKKLNLFMSVTPILLMLLWIKPMTKNNVVPGILSEGAYEYLRLCFVIAVVIARLCLLRKDVQEFLNQGQGIVYSVILNPSRESVEHAAFQIKALASYAWSYAHQGLCNYFVALTLCVLLVYKVDLTDPYPNPVKEIAELPPLELDTEEFLVGESFNSQAALIMPSRAKFYYPELRDIEILIQEASTNRTSDTTEMDIKSYIKLLSVVNRKGIIPEVFYRDLLEFALWQYCLIWAFGTIFSILYSRKFGSSSSSKAKVD